MTVPDSSADKHEFAGVAQVHRRFARTIDGYLAWKQGDPGSALEATRRLDRFAVTARWYLAEVLVETGQSLEAAGLVLPRPATAGTGRTREGPGLDR